MKTFPDTYPPDINSDAVGHMQSYSRPHTDAFLSAQSPSATGYLPHLCPGYGQVFHIMKDPEWKHHNGYAPGALMEVYETSMMSVVFEVKKHYFF